MFKKTLFVSAMIFAASLSFNAFADQATKTNDGWMTLSGANSCLHNGRKVEMHRLNSMQREKQCFSYHSKLNQDGKRVYKHVSRDGSVTIQGRRLG
jgi:hypothetical protein